MQSEGSQPLTGASHVTRSKRGTIERKFCLSLTISLGHVSITCIEIITCKVSSWPVTSTTLKSGLTSPKLKKKMSSHAVSPFRGSVRTSMCLSQNKYHQTRARHVKMQNIQQLLCTSFQLFETLWYQCLRLWIGPISGILSTLGEEVAGDWRRHSNVTT